MRDRWLYEIILRYHIGLLKRKQHSSEMEGEMVYEHQTHVEDKGGDSSDREVT